MTEFTNRVFNTTHSLLAHEASNFSNDSKRAYFARAVCTVLEKNHMYRPK